MKTKKSELEYISIRDSAPMLGYEYRAWQSIWRKTCVENKIRFKCPSQRKILICKTDIEKYLSK